MSKEPTNQERVASIFIDAPVEAVWEEITKTGSVQRAVYNTVLASDMRPGSRLRYANRAGSRVFVVGEVIEVTRPNRFVQIPTRRRQ